MLDPKKIQHLDYVVQRNWDFPEGHDDLDLFVSLEDRVELEDIVGDDPLVDIRYPGDGYYPVGIERFLLLEPVRHGDWKIPNPLAHFFSLYYHNAVHKEGNPYGDKLKQLFFDIFPPIKADDPGVGYYV